MAKAPKAKRSADPKCRLCFQVIRTGEQFVYFQGDLFHGRCYVEIATKKSEGGAVLCHLCSKGIRRVVDMTIRGGKPVHTVCLRKARLD
jgi:hypothetical protein